MTAGIINKTMDRRDLTSLEATAVVREIDALVHELHGRDLEINSWYGVSALGGEPESFERVNRGYGYVPLEGVADDRRFLCFLLLGSGSGCSSTTLSAGRESARPRRQLLALLLVSRLTRLDVTTVDLNAELVENANAVGRAMG